MSELFPKDWLTSKEILLKTGISRATLNNYIKMEILPRPLVKKPRGRMGGTKKIGCFPPGVLERIQEIQVMKRSGKTMDEVVHELRHVPVRGHENVQVADEEETVEKEGAVEQETTLNLNQGPRLSFGEIGSPAYLVNYEFQVEWINQEAEEEIFGRPVRLLKGPDSRNIFRLLFHWQFHDRVKNWKDLIAFHMSFAKVKYTKGWMENIYLGISEGEVRVLKEVYEKVDPVRMKTVMDSALSMLMEDGATKTYRVYSVFFMEGIFFVYS
jgi:adenylate cyclase